MVLVNGVICPSASCLFSATDINAALLEGVQMLNRFKETHPQSGTASILILLTDGDPTSGTKHVFLYFCVYPSRSVFDLYRSVYICFNLFRFIFV